MNFITLVIGKIIIKLSRLAGHSGTALAGKIMETLNPRLLNSLNKQIPEGVIVVTGTNGKTTTTKMIVELLESEEAKVFTNKSGSNFTRGILSAMADKATIFGRLNYDIAVLELDEAYFKHFAKRVNPRVALVTNLFRDQLDRYGEVATTADHIRQALRYSESAVLYAGDPQVVDLKSALPNDAKVTYFGVSAKLRKQLPNDNELHGDAEAKKVSAPDSLVSLQKFKVTKGVSKATFKSDKNSHDTTLQLRGTYNALNATAAVAVVKSLIPAIPSKRLIGALSEIRPAFGRGEVFKVNDAQVIFGLVKNPAGFNQNIKTLVTSSTKKLLIIINDNFADGRDVSWLWDVDVDPLSKFKGKIYIAGIRAEDMALRLKYAGIKYEQVSHDPVGLFNELTESKGELAVLPTYTAMMGLRKTMQASGLAKEIY